MKSTAGVDPLAQLSEALLRVEKPARYVGGEYGQIVKNSAVFNMAIAFPDLYEIGMSNQALKILYKGLNDIDLVRCERVFAPAADFESELRNAGVPLYTLESGLPLNELDLIGFTLGYELGATGMLAILDAGLVPLLAADRGREHPLVILGGPAASNPSPFSLFVDGVWIGEAEDAFFSLTAELARMKAAGADKADLLERMRRESAFWTPGKKASRAMDESFSVRKPDPAVFPIPSMKVVQDHGAVEIMRGCPNGCRFCHAGVWYRPMRQKPVETIEAEVDRFVGGGGYREVSLSSLSSGDYAPISALVSRLNSKYKNRNISFQLPSLKVSTFSLPLLETISEVRKSGLTFAIETPVDAWQLSINKEVSIGNVVSIMREAKLRGWKQAKFYFMIGLPVHPEAEASEEAEIISFLKRIKKEANLAINVNIGTFVPKAHTPYQWCAQITEEEAHRKLKLIREELRGLGFKVSTHDPFVSILEGLISRGDARVGSLIHKAYLRGCRLDAWEDHIRKDIWRALLEEEGRPLLEENRKERELDSILPWEEVDPGVGKNFLKREYQRSIDRTLSPICENPCSAPCGACRDDEAVVVVAQPADLPSIGSSSDHATQTPAVGTSAPERPTTRRIVFSFSKNGSARFWPHLSLVEIFSKAFIRADLPVFFTEGFNPLPKLDFASPLSLGLSADNEIATIDMKESVEEVFFVDRLNRALPKDLVVKKALAFEIPEGVKKHSPAAMLWGFSYKKNDIEYRHPASDDKAFRESLLQEGERLPSGLMRTFLWAKSLDGQPVSYFDAYAELYILK